MSVIPIGKFDDRSPITSHSSVELATGLAFVRNPDVEMRALPASILGFTSLADGRPVAIPLAPHLRDITEALGRLADRRCQQRQQLLRLGRVEIEENDRGEGNGEASRTALGSADDTLLATDLSVAARAG